MHTLKYIKTLAITGAIQETKKNVLSLQTVIDENVDDSNVLECYKQLVRSYDALINRLNINLK